MVPQALSVEVGQQVMRVPGQAICGHTSQPVCDYLSIIVSLVARAEAC